MPDGSGLDGGVLSAEDLEVGGKYHIPKRKKFGWFLSFVAWFFVFLFFVFNFYYYGDMWVCLTFI